MFRALFIPRTVMTLIVNQLCELTVYCLYIWYSLTVQMKVAQNLHYTLKVVYLDIYYFLSSLIFPPFILVVNDYLSGTFLDM